MYPMLCRVFLNTIDYSCTKKRTYDSPREPAAAGPFFDTPVRDRGRVMGHVPCQNEDEDEQTRYSTFNRR